MNKDDFNYKRNLQQLDSTLQWRMVDTCLHDVKLDANSTKILTRVNLLAIIKASPAIDARVKRLSLFDHYLHPIIGYFDNAGVFRVVAGITSYYRVLINKPTQLPAFVFTSKPRKDKLDMLLFAELTAILLERQPISGVENLHKILCKLFETQTAGIFTSPFWQALYPQVSNKAQLCKWQGISSKTFRDKSELSDG
ncbi:MAG: hypothetical protein KKE94_14605 [Gammaproteobacteria bacterium]|nr:hypothetical protein [Gammaproteobacteria bacterium]